MLCRVRRIKVLAPHILLPVSMPLFSVVGLLQFVATLSFSDVASGLGWATDTRKRANEVKSHPSSGSMSAEFDISIYISPTLSPRNPFLLAALRLPRIDSTMNV